jgi:hypothetical protein
VCVCAAGTGFNVALEAISGVDKSSDLGARGHFENLRYPSSGVARAWSRVLYDMLGCSFLLKNVAEEFIDYVKVAFGANGVFEGHEPGNHMARHCTLILTG